MLLILANGLFSGAEIAVVSVRRSRIEELAAEGRRAAKALLALRDRPERLLATVQIGITVVGATAAAYGGSSLSQHVTPLIRRIPWLAAEAEELALAAIVVGVSFLSIVLGELVPKSLALRSAEPYALLVARPVVALASFMRPLVWFMTKSSNLILKPFGDSTTFSETQHSAEELQQLVEEATVAGTVHPGAGEIAARALRMPHLTAADVMVPRQTVVMIPRHAPPAEVQRILLEHTHTRMPVYEGSFDNVVGYVHVRDLLAFAWDNRLVILEDVMRPAPFVPETQPAIDLLQDMRKRRNPFAIVIDEQGGMSGIVTMEDLLEELVGEIFSEHTQQVPQIITAEPGEQTFLIAGHAAIREVNRELHVELPEERDYTTLAGLAIALAGRIPAVGETFSTVDGISLEIVDASARRVRLVRLRCPPKHEAPAARHHPSDRSPSGQG